MHRPLTKRGVSRLALTLVGLLAWPAFLPHAAAQTGLPRATGRQLALADPAWRLFVPTGYSAPADGGVDLLVHFHGDSQTVWNNAAHAELDSVIVTVNYPGLSSAYSTPFADSSLFDQLLSSARTRLAAEPDFPGTTRWERLAVSSFSAGYGAVRRLLATPSHFDRIDALLAADSLYASTASDGTPRDSQMANYKRFADQAAAGDKTFIFTHSQVATTGYESTVETADELLQHLGLPASPTNRTGLGPLRYYREAERGGFRLWGARGADAEGHLNHLRYLGEWLDDLGLGAARTPVGDYNGDGVIDAADYTVWRDHRDGFGGPRQGDGDGNGFINDDDYRLWAEWYGARLDEPTLARATPEPAAWALTAALAFTLTRGRSTPRWESPGPRDRDR